jgi:hypothetical protein
VAVAVAVVAVAIVLVRPAHPATPPSAQSTPNPNGPAPPAPKPLLPPHPSRQQQQEVDYLYHATGDVDRSDHACRGTPPGQRRQFTVSNGAPPSALLSILGVLRRPAQPTDALPTRVVGLDHQVIPNGSLPPAKDIYVHYIRRARWRFGAGYYVVPAGNVNQSGPIPSRCYAEHREALERELQHVPVGLRRPTLALEPRFLAGWRYSTLPYAGVCLLALNSTGGGDVGCGSSVSDIESGHTLSTGGPTGVPVAYGLVPDGVATVTYYLAGRHAGHPITVHAIGNVFIVPLGRHAPQDGFPAKMVWRSATGEMIKTISGP